MCILNILIYWYSNLFSMVKWNSALSSSFLVNSGVRQGGVLSPHLFAVYLDDLIVTLRRLKTGCHIIDLFIAALIYADDICLLAPCRSSLQLLLDTCEAYGRRWCLSYNPSKSKTMIFGKLRDIKPLNMYEENLECVEKYKYLGVDVVAGSKIGFSSIRSLIKFRSSANTVLNVHNKPSEPILMKLLYSVCVPNLTYACEAVSYSSKEIESLNVALNDSVRRIFDFNRWESVRYLRSTFGYPSITEIFYSRREMFHFRLPFTKNQTLISLQQYAND